MSHGPSVLTESLPHIDLVSVASETEGFLAADIKAFIERTVHEGAVRSIKKKLDDIKQGEIEDATSKQELRLTQADFTKAREGFVPTSLRGVKLQSSGVNWSDIGGECIRCVTHGRPVYSSHLAQVSMKRERRCWRHWNGLQNTQPFLHNVLCD